MNKKNIVLLLIIFMFTSVANAAATFAMPDDEECEGCNVELLRTVAFLESTPPYKVEVYYVGSPVDQRTLLSIKAKCLGSDTFKEIYTNQECDFSNFKSISTNSFSFDVLYYNPVNGNCDRKIENKEINISNFCKKLIENTD